MPSNFDRVSVDPKPFFGARFGGGSVRVEGQAERTFGRRIPVLGQRLDEGVFAEWRWDGKRLTVSNDRYGLYPLFYCAKADSIWVSPSLAHVVGGNSSRELDFPALGIFHRMGHFVAEDTPFADIRFLPPNSTLVWENGQTDLRVEPPTVGQQIDERLAFDDAVDKYQQLFAQSITRRLPTDDRFTVPLSGGRDSRHILLELVRQGWHPKWCATVKYRPPATNQDAHVAHLLTQRLGIAHEVLDKPSSYFQAELMDIHLTNHCGGGHGWVLPVASRLSGEVSTMYDGLAGSVLSGGFMLAEQKIRLFRQRDFDTLARLILQENQLEDKLRHVLAGGAYRSMPLGDAVERLVPELKKHADLPNPVLSFVFWNRTRRCVGSIPFATFHQVPCVHVPYLDHALFDFLCSLDTSMVEDNRLHDATIRRAYPEFADIPYQDKKARAAFLPADHSYYRQARKEFFAYLNHAPSPAQRAVKRPYLFAKLAGDFVTRQIDPPWYMRTALQAVELECLRGGH